MQRREFLRLGLLASGALVLTPGCIRQPRFDNFDQVAEYFASNFQNYNKLARSRKINFDESQNLFWEILSTSIIYAQQGLPGSLETTYKTMVYEPGKKIDYRDVAQALKRDFERHGYVLDIKIAPNPFHQGQGIFDISMTKIDEKSEAKVNIWGREVKFPVYETRKMMIETLFQETSGGDLGAICLYLGSFYDTNQNIVVAKSDYNDKAISELWEKWQADYRKLMTVRRRISPKRHPEVLLMLNFFSRVPTDSYERFRESVSPLIRTSVMTHEGSHVMLYRRYGNDTPAPIEYHEAIAFCGEIAFGPTWDLDAGTLGLSPPDNETASYINAFDLIKSEAILRTLEKPLDDTEKVLENATRSGFRKKGEVLIEEVDKKIVSKKPNP